MRKAYQTDLSDTEWSCLRIHLPTTPKPTGRPRLHDRRQILDAIFYILRGGCAWRLLPHDFFPPWKSVYHYFRLWRLDGTWEKLNAAIRERVRVRLGRDPQPSAGSVDSHSVKSSTGVGGRAARLRRRQADKGQKAPHPPRDGGFAALKVKVHSARIFERDGIKLLLENARDLFPRMEHLWLDAGYNGQGKGADWVEKILGWRAEIVKRPSRWVWVPEGVEPPPYPKGFIVLSRRRWVVERSFSWTGQNRRLSKDYERVPESGEAFMYAAMTRLMARRLARS
jgi:putative transposase